MKPQTIHYALIATGTVALCISIAAGLQFYVSLGYSVGGMFIYGLAGVVIAIACAFMLPIVIGLWQSTHVLSAVFFAFVWIGLSILQIYSEFGFFAKEQSSAESARAISSDSYQNAKKRYESLSMYSHLSVEGLSAKKAGIEKQIASLEETLQSYPAKYKTKRKQIADQINEQTGKLADIESSIANAEKYATAQKEFDGAAKPNASKENSSVHAAYQWGETLTGIPAHTIQVWTSVCIAIFLELWASAAAFLIMKLFNGNAEQHQHWQAYNNHLAQAQMTAFQTPVHAPLQMSEQLHPKT